MYNGNRLLAILLRLCDFESQTMRPQLLCACLAISLPLAAACNRGHSQGANAVVDVATREFQVKGYRLQVFDNSETFSEVRAIDKDAAVIGMREVADSTQTIFSHAYFHIDQGKMRRVPAVEGYTNVEVQAFSSAGRAAGFASRPVGHPGGSLTAIVWDIAAGRITQLSPAPDDSASHAQDMTADGNLVTGYTTGESRIRPCVWNFDEASQTWKITVLSTIEQYNPFIMSSQVIVAPDGNRIAACITVEILAGNQCDSSLHVWKRTEDDWQRELISDEQMHLKDMNNRGEMAVASTVASTRIPCLVRPNGEIVRIALFAGDASGEAHGINDDGLIVGFSDDPHGPDGGPRAFIWSDGRSQALPVPEGVVFSAAHCINDRGQIGGLVDLIVEDAQAEAPESPKIKTLAAIWTPIEK